MKSKFWKTFLKTNVILILALVLCTSWVSAADTVQTVTFAWDHDDPAEIENFEMHWGVTAGGPYAELAIIPKSGAGPGFQSPVDATVTGTPATTETRYFVLRACGEVPAEGGGTTPLCSDWSNEVAHGFWIPHGGFSVPVQFRIIAQ